MLCTLQQFDGNVERWFGRCVDQFEDIMTQCRASGDIQTLKAALEAFEKPLHHAAGEGIEQGWAWENAARAATTIGASPAKRLAYFARAYELQLKEQQEKTFENLECILHGHFQLADYLYEMALIHEADGDLKMAAELYQRSVQHLQDASDAADAGTNAEKRGLPRRPQYLASLERVKQLLK